MLRFHLPLIEPDVRICRIRLWENVHAIACGKRRGSLFNRSKVEWIVGMVDDMGIETASWPASFQPGTNPRM